MLNTKKSLAPIVTLGFAAVAASTAYADGGTIEFRGQLTDQTCSVAVNGGTSSATVTLPTISTTQLAAADQVAGKTAFTIKLSSCQNATATSARAYFQDGAAVDVLSGHLRNTAATGAATKVELQLLDGGTTPIRVGDTSQVAKTGGTSLVDFDAVSGAALLHYSVEYFALGQTTPGAVESSVTYSIDYQ
jgi:major type 1 subunit fimbrin (pilin)